MGQHQCIDLDICSKETISKQCSEAPESAKKQTQEQSKRLRKSVDEGTKVVQENATCALDTTAEKFVEVVESGAVAVQNGLEVGASKVATAIEVGASKVASTVEVGASKVASTVEVGVFTASSKLEETSSTAASKVSDKIGHSVGALKQNVESGVHVLIQKVEEGKSQAVDALDAAGEKLVDGVVDGVASAGTKVGSALTDGAHSLQKGLAYTTETATHTAVEGATEVAHWAKNGIVCTAETATHAAVGGATELAHLAKDKATTAVHVADEILQDPAKRTEVVENAKHKVEAGFVAIKHAVSIVSVEVQETIHEPAAKIHRLEEKVVEKVDQAAESVVERGSTIGSIVDSSLTNTTHVAEDALKSAAQTANCVKETGQDMLFRGATAVVTAANDVGLALMHGAETAAETVQTAAEVANQAETKMEQGICVVGSKLPQQLKDGARVIGSEIDIIVDTSLTSTAHVREDALNSAAHTANIVKETGQDVLFHGATAVVTAANDAGLALMHGAETAAEAMETAAEVANETLAPVSLVAAGAKSREAWNSKISSLEASEDVREVPFVNSDKMQATTPADDLPTRPRVAPQLGIATSSAPNASHAEGTSSTMQMTSKSDNVVVVAPAAPHSHGNRPLPPAVRAALANSNSLSSTTESSALASPAESRSAETMMANNRVDSVASTNAATSAMSSASTLEAESIVEGPAHAVLSEFCESSECSAPAVLSEICESSEHSERTDEALASVKSPAGSTFSSRVFRGVSNVIAQKGDALKPVDYSDKLSLLLEGQRVRVLPGKNFDRFHGGMEGAVVKNNAEDQYMLILFDGKMDEDPLQVAYRHLQPA